MPRGYDLQDEVAIAMNHVVPIGGTGGFPRLGWLHLHLVDPMEVDSLRLS